MEKGQLAFLEWVAYDLRTWSLKMTSQAGSGHATSALSAADIISVLFFYAMRYDPRDYKNPNNDRFILSKGHAAPVLYAAWKAVGVLTNQELMTYRQFDSVLEGHPTLRFAYTEAATGALGIGLSIGAGEAYNAKMDGLDYRTYVLLGDSEMSEGCIWEAVQIAAHYKLNNLIGIIDCNRLGQSTQTIEGWDTGRYQAMMNAFGWYAIVVDGHDIAALIKAFDEAHSITDKPVMIIAKTVKGYGVFQAANKEGFHGKAFKHDELPNILDGLKKQFPQAAAYDADYAWKPLLPRAVERPKKRLLGQLPKPEYRKDEPIATRYAYGQALAALGAVNELVVSLDAEVKNSTYAELFEKAYPDRFVQCFIAEQNMISMGVGFNRRGKIPFISTFGAFFSRAYDQIRMAAIGSASLRLVGSHAGVSIGEDGPSQMGLEDISMMTAIPASVVFYPADAVSTYKIVGLMADYDAGISYLRTTRMATPVLYDVDQSFTIGGCHVLRHNKGVDQVCIIAAGITLINALKAYDLLAKHKKPISISVIDLYCIKPLDLKTITTVAQASGKRVITVEDHYAQGGIGQIIAAALCNTDIQVYSLAVEKMPRSGTPDQLMAYEGIDVDAIVRKVQQII